VSQEFEDLKSDIISVIGASRQEATGFYSIHCPICKKENRKTGGFKFEDDKIIYHCFRGSCDADTVYQLGEYVPKKFRRLMDEIHVQIPLSLRTSKSRPSFTQEKLDEDLYEKNSYIEMQIPDDWVPLSEDDSERGMHWRNYLDSRMCDYVDCYLIKKGQYKGLLAIAMYFYDRLIGYQVISRDKQLYIKVTENKSLLYLPEREIPENPIIVEGTLDAKCFPNTIAVLSNNISPRQAYHLRNTKSWTFFPDRTGGNKFVESIKLYGKGNLVVPDWSDNDLNAAVCRYGVIECAYRIKNSTYDSLTNAEIRYKMWRKEGNK